ncbi:hypothetical protein C8Q75DRAFT_731800 [Abortiporus biennis]|nr:hypothetical protein C8Q75DRAFT_731800 [Abortiporus biennis]
MPSFTYDQDAALENNTLASAFKGHYGLHVLHHIFTGLCTTKKESPGSSAGPTTKVKIYKIIQVTPEIIIQGSWSLTDRDFNSVTFYKVVITMIGTAGDAFYLEPLIYVLIGQSNIIIAKKAYDNSLNPDSLTH